MTLHPWCLAQEVRNPQFFEYFVSVGRINDKRENFPTRRLDRAPCEMHDLRREVIDEDLHI